MMNLLAYSGVGRTACQLYGSEQMPSSEREQSPESP